MVEAMSSTVYLGLGSNMGDRTENLRSAVERLSRRMAVVSASSVYETEPVGYEDQPLFLNAVVAAVDAPGPFELLALAKEIEADLGRAPGLRDGPRPIDIDILVYGEMVIRTAALTVPHPRLAERAFALVPLAEIAGGLVEPASGQKVSSLLAAVGGMAGVGRVDGVALMPEGGR